MTRHRARHDRDRGPGQQLVLDLPGLPAVRRDDHITSLAASRQLAGHVSALQAQVLAAFERLGGLTDAELEDLPEFAGFGPSTIRKRRSELYYAKRLCTAGIRANDRGYDMLIWRITDHDKTDPQEPDHGRPPGEMAADTDRC